MSVHTKKNFKILIGFSRVNRSPKHFLNKKQIIAISSLIIVICILFIIIHQPSFNGGWKSVIPYSTKSEQDNAPFVSFCSREADRRGLRQNVIAYSLYGDFSNPKVFARYVDPLKLILANISQAFPGKDADLKFLSYCISIIIF